jgi:hypothetical protein
MSQLPFAGSARNWPRILNGFHEGWFRSSIGHLSKNGIFVMRSGPSATMHSLGTQENEQTEKYQIPCHICIYVPIYSLSTSKRERISDNSKPQCSPNREDGIETAEIEEWTRLHLIPHPGHRYWTRNRNAMMVGLNILLPANAIRRRKIAIFT